MLERAIRQDRALVAGGVAGITLLSWLSLIRMASAHDAMAGDQLMHAAMGMPAMTTWGARELVSLVIMWTIMMIAMMLPSAAPLLLLVAGTYRRRGPRAAGLTTVFAGGYLLAWTVFSVVAASAQLGLHRAALLSPAMRTTSAVAGGVLLLVAGAYQWLPFKAACLTHCRSPLSFLTRYWREGTRGALTMGARHGFYCVGCCWALMTLLFVAGVMNLLWIAALAVFVLLEKLAPRGVRVGQLTGAALIAWGVWVLAHAV